MGDTAAAAVADPARLIGADFDSIHLSWEARNHSVEVAPVQAALLLPS